MGECTAQVGLSKNMLGGQLDSLRHGVEEGDHVQTLRIGTLSPHRLCFDSPSSAMTPSLEATLPTQSPRQGNDFATSIRLPRGKEGQRGGPGTESYGNQGQS